MKTKEKTKPRFANHKEPSRGASLRSNLIIAGREIATCAKQLGEIVPDLAAGEHAAAMLRSQQHFLESSIESYRACLEQNIAALASSAAPTQGPEAGDGSSAAEADAKEGASLDDTEDEESTDADEDEAQEDEEEEDEEEPEEEEGEEDVDAEDPEEEEEEEEPAAKEEKTTSRPPTTAPAKPASGKTGVPPVNRKP